MQRANIVFRKAARDAGLVGEDEDVIAASFSALIAGAMPGIQRNRSRVPT
jgi:uncharacterized protein YsxB (DUF464 family)